MRKQLGIMAGVLGVILLASGCMNQRPPADSSIGLNGLQQRALTARNIGEDLDATYNDVWYSVISTLQLNGFILKQADKNSGFIYGVWQDTYEAQTEFNRGGLILTQISTNPSWYTGAFFSKTTTYKQIEVSVTLEPLAKTQTLVRLVSRFDNQGIPTAHGIFANRFFGLLRKEIFLRKNSGSIYQKFNAANTANAASKESVANKKSVANKEK